MVQKLVERINEFVESNKGGNISYNKKKSDVYSLNFNK